METKKYKYYIIYKTTFLHTKEYYIGKHCTNNIDDGYLGSGEKLKPLISKYGEENFERVILAYGDNNRQLMALEGFYINKKNITDALCLNMTSGLSVKKQEQYKSGKNIEIKYIKVEKIVKVKTDNHIIEAYKEEIKFLHNKINTLYLQDVNRGNKAVLGRNLSYLLIPKEKTIKNTTKDLTNKNGYSSF